MTKQFVVPEDEARALRRYFFIAVGCGAVSLTGASLFGANTGFLFYLLTLGVPVGVMGLYIYYGSVRHGGNSHQFADSVYFLGFVFTLLALVVSMVSLTGIRNNPNLIDAFLARFGVALLTTLVGLVARIALINFRETAEDSLTRSQAALTRATTTFKNQLEQQSLRLRQTHEALNGFHEEQLKRSAATSDAAAKYWMTSTEQTATEVDRMLRKTTADMTEVLAEIGGQSKDKLPAAATAMATVVEGAATAMNSKLAVMVQAMDAGSKDYLNVIGKHVTAIDAGVGKTAKIMDEYGKSFAASLVRQSTAVETTVKSLEIIASGSTELVASFGQLKTQGAAASTALQLVSQSVSQVGQSVSQYGNVDRQLRDIVANLERLSKGCQEYEVAFKSQRDTLGALVRHTGEDLKTVQEEKIRLRAAVQEAGETISLMQTQFVEAAEYIRQELAH